MTARRIILYLCLGAFAVFAGNEILLCSLSPSGVWIRKVVREHPLKAPIKVVGIEKTSIVTASNIYALAGVALPSDATQQAAAHEFLRLATAQGIEVIRGTGVPPAYLLRCEPRIWHWCGNDRVAAHFEQHCLNELILALGYASFDPSVVGLTEDETHRMLAAEKLGRENASGIWASGAKERDRRISTYGIDFSEIIAIESAIRTYAYDMRTIER